MSPLLISISYVGLHFAAYILVGRHCRSLHGERGIFLYHALSYVVALLVAGLNGVRQPWNDTLVLALLLTGLHGIYSLSFLELWSLTQGSYSLGILDRIERTGGSARATELASLQAVGTGKQHDRTGDLARLGLLRSNGELSPAGRGAAWLVRAILGLSHGKTMN